MPYHRYGSPECPKRKEHEGYQFECMIRAYYRDPETRQFLPFGWFCLQCRTPWTDEDPELRESMKNDPS